MTAASPRFSAPGQWTCHRSRSRKTGDPFETRYAMENLLDRITVDPDIFGGKPIIRGRRLAVEHVLGMLAAGDTPEAILEAYPWLEREDIRACLTYAHRMVEHERVEPFIGRTAA
jgi:uncharacterized protein (DUF433 family)